MNPRPLALLLAFLFFVPGLRAQESTNIYFAVTKTQTYYQTSSAAPLLDCELPYSFLASAFGDELFFLLSAVSVRTPVGSVLSLSPTNVLELTKVFRVFDAGTHQEDLEADYPSGLYRATVDYSLLGLFSDQTTIDIRLEGDGYPNTPRFLNVDSATPVVPSRELTLAWEPLQQPGELDGVGLLIFLCTNQVDVCTNCVGDLVYRAYPSSADPAPKVTIPAGTLKPDLKYEAMLVFDRCQSTFVTNTTVAMLFPLDIVARSSYTKVTRLPLVTITPPQLRLLSTAGADPFRWEFNATVKGQYEVQESVDCRTWTTILATNATATTVHIEQPWSADLPPHFYRVFRP